MYVQLKRTHMQMIEQTGQSYMEGYMGVLSTLLANFLYFIFLANKKFKKCMQSLSQSKVPLIANNRIIVTRGGGRNSWLLLVQAKERTSRISKQQEANGGT